MIKKNKHQLGPHHKDDKDWETPIQQPETGIQMAMRVMKDAYDTELQEQIDITIKLHVDHKYDEELGLTGRNVHQVIIRLAAALEQRDEELAEYEERTRE